MTTPTSRPSAGTGVTIRTILCPVDLSDFSPPILAHAMALAKWYGAEVTALHVFAAWMPPASLATYPGWMMQVPEAGSPSRRSCKHSPGRFSRLGVRFR